MGRHRTFLLTWNPEQGRPKDLTLETRITQEESLRFPYSWSTGSRMDLPAGSRVFLLRQHVEPTGIIASGWCTKSPKGECAADFEFTLILDWTKGQILSEVMLMRQFPLVYWQPAGGGVDISSITSGLEATWKEELSKHALKEAGKERINWLRMKLLRLLE